MDVPLKGSADAEKFLYGAAKLCIGVTAHPLPSLWHTAAGSLADTGDSGMISRIACHTPRTGATQRLLQVAVFICATFIAVGAEASGPAPHASTARFETEFMENIIDHHALAVKLASLCEGRATHAELITMCNEMRAAQLEEIGKLQVGLKAWYGITHEPQLFDHEMQDLAQMASLSGAEFEKVFMKMMVPHHLVAIEEASVCLVRAYHGQLLNLCHDMVKMQSEEIRTLRDWLCKWYEICDLNFRRSALVDKPADQRK